MNIRSHINSRLNWQADSYLSEPDYLHIPDDRYGHSLFSHLLGTTSFSMDTFRDPSQACEQVVGIRDWSGPCAWSSGLFNDFVLLLLVLGTKLIIYLFLCCEYFVTWCIRTSILVVFVRHHLPMNCNHTEGCSSTSRPLLYSCAVSVFLWICRLSCIPPHYVLLFYLLVEVLMGNILFDLILIW